jgi:uncharacterized cupin superfamily protein
MKVLRMFLAAALLAAASTWPALAVDDELATRITACTREKDDALRLACFDRAAAPQEPAAKRISATVTAIETRTRGELVVTLDNGQVWAQKDSGTYFPLKVGDAVTILAGTLGSFRLISGNRATAVTRVQ